MTFGTSVGQMLKREVCYKREACKTLCRSKYDVDHDLALA